MHVNHVHKWHNELETIEELMVICSEVLKETNSDSVRGAAQADLERLTKEKNHLLDLLESQMH